MRQPLDDLEKKIINLQHSTSTTLPLFTRVHDKLRMKNKWYYNWHLKPNSGKIHKAIAIVYTLGMLLTFINFTLYYSVQKVTAASYTWDGGGLTNNWSDCDNWSTNVCPTSADTVNFNTTSTKDSVVDASFDGVIASLSVSTGYSGTLSLDRSLNVTGAYTQQTGTFTAGSNTFDVDGVFTLSGGTFNASSGSTLVSSTFTVSGSPTFNHNNGTVEFDGATSVALTCNNITFNLVRFTATNNQKTINTGCTMPLGNDPSVAFNIRLLGGTLSGTGTIAFSGQFQHSGGTLSGFTGITIFSTFTLNGGTLDLSGYNPRTITSATTLSAGGTLTVPNDFTFTSNFTLNGGTFNAPAGTVTFNGHFTVSSGTFNANSGTVAFGGTVTATLACVGVTFNNVTFTHINQTKTVNNTCTLPLGADPIITGPINLVGTLSGSGTLTYNSTMQVNGATTPFSGFSGIVGTSTFILAVGGGTVDFSAYTTVDFNGALTINAGTFTAPSGTMTVASNITYSGGTFNHNNGTVILDGSAGTINCGAMAFNYVQFNHTSSKIVSAGCTLPLGADPYIPTSLTVNGTLSGTGTVSIQTNTITLNSGGSFSGFTGLVGIGAANLTVAGATADMSNYTTFDVSSFTLSSGTFTAPTGTMTVRVNYVASSGTFNGNGGTLSLSSNGNLTCSGATNNFSLVTFGHVNGTRTISGCNVPMGNNPASIYQTSLTNSTLSGTGTLTIHGSMTLNSGSNLSGFTGFVANNGIVLSGGTFDFSGYSTVDINNTVTLNSGTFTAPAGNMTMASTITYSGGTFNHNNGTVTFDGTSGTISCGAMTFNLVVLASTRTLNSCNFPLGANPTLSGNIILNSSTLNGSGNLTAQAITFNSGSTISGFTNATINGAFTIAGATVDLSSLTLVDVNGSLTLSSGSFTAPPTFHLSGNWTQTGGTFSHNNGIVIFDAGGATLSCGNATFKLVRIETTNTSTKTINGDCTLPLGSNPMTTGAINLTGTLTGSGTLTTTNNLTINNNGSVNGTLTGFSALTIGNALVIQAEGGTLSDFSSFDTVTTTGAISLTSGIFKAPKVLNIGGNWNHSNGDFIHNNGTVNLTGREQTINGTNTFYNLSKILTTAPSVSLNVAGDTTQTIVNQATLHGVSTAARLRLTGTGTIRWKFDPQSARDFKFLDVVFTENINSKPINLAETGSNDRGGNLGFVWFTPTVASLGPTNLIDASTSSNNTPTFTFTTADKDGGDTVSYQIQIDDTADFSSPTVDHTSALAKPGAMSFTVGQSSGTYTTGGAGQPLNNGSYLWRVRAIDSNGTTSAWVSATTNSTAFSITGQSVPIPTPSPVGTPSTLATILVELRVQIRDENNQPAAGADVTLYSEPRHATTDAQGIAHFSDVPVGEHTLVVAYNGKVGEKQIIVEADPENIATITAEAKPVEVTVQLKDSKPINYYLWLIPTMIALLIVIVLILLRFVHYNKYHPGDHTRLLP